MMIKLTFIPSLVGNALAPQFPLVNIAEFNKTGCSLNVSWSEPAISCAGSVSQYVMTVTPPTSDCQSSGDCIVMDGSAVITRPGTDAHYTINVNASQSDIKVRADTCNTIHGEISQADRVDLRGDYDVLINDYYDVRE